MSPAWLLLGLFALMWAADALGTALAGVLA